jgi:hypothetical protein
LNNSREAQLGRHRACRCIIRRRSISRRGNAGIAEGQDISGLAELRCVEGVEGFGAELKVHLLCHLEALVDRDVGVIEAGSVAIQSPGCIAVGIGQRRSECTQIEIGPEAARSSKTALRPTGIAGTDPRKQTRTLVGSTDTSRSECTGAQIGLNNRQGPSVLDDRFIIDLPSPDERINPSIGVSKD